MKWVDGFAASAELCRAIESFVALLGEPGARVDSGPGMFSNRAVHSFSWASFPRQVQMAVATIVAGWLAVEPTRADGLGWPQFRGPNGGGVAMDARPPVRLQGGLETWQSPAPKGLSSPVLARGKAFLTGVEGDQLVTVAWDAAGGRRLWRAAAPTVALEPVHAINSAATPTPCTDGTRLFVYFGSFGLLCYDLDGRELWRKAIPTPKSLYGSASSPIVRNGQVMLVLDSDANLPDSKLSQSRMLAINATNGETIWETARPLVRSGWSTPAIWNRADGDELVVLGTGRVDAYDLRSGLGKWFLTGFARETIALPVFGDDRVYVASAMGGQADERPDLESLWTAMLHFDTDGDGRIGRNEINEYFTFPLRPEVPPSHPGFGIPLASDPERRRRQQEGYFASLDKDRDGFWTRAEFVANLGPRPFRPRLVAIKPGGRGDVAESHVAWEVNRAIPEIPSPVFYESRVYLIRNGGILTAVEAANGRQLYSERLGADGQYMASPIGAGGHIYLISNRGIVSIVKAGATFARVDQFDLGEACSVTPAVDERTLYVRTESHLRAFRSR